MAGKRKNTIKYWILGIGLGIIVIGLMILTVLNGRVTLNPAGTVGNTAGNLNNSGLVCEHEGLVYFSNSYDEGKIYSMTPDETNIKKVIDVRAVNLLAGGRYLYYFQYGKQSDGGLGSFRAMHTLNRYDLKTRNTASLTRDIVVHGQLIDNYLYLNVNNNSTLEFYRLKIDESEKEHLTDYEINPVCVSGDTIYYYGTVSDHNLYSYNTTTGIAKLILEGNVWSPAIYGDYIYYIDLARDYQLCRYSLANNQVQILTHDRVESFNVGSGYIYYQSMTGSPNGVGLMVMNNDGSNLTTLAEGIYNSINLSSTHVYFQAYGDDSTLYHSTLGSTAYQAFTAARDAVKKK